MNFLTFDVEPDIHTKNYNGIILGIPLILKILEKHNIKATFFTTCDCIENYPQTFKKLKKKGHEIALHGYRHERFDDMSLVEKEENIKKSLTCFNKILNQYPYGFRAPQHSIDKETLDLLEKYEIRYDSSYTPFNTLQILFFPKNFKQELKKFFSSTRKYKIRKKLYEIPVSSFFIPAVSLIFRVFPKSLIKVYFYLLKILNKDIIIYFHSWDFIDLPKSRIAKKWPKEKMIDNFEYFLKINKNNKFGRLIDLVN